MDIWSKTPWWLWRVLTLISRKIQTKISVTQRPCGKSSNDHSNLERKTQLTNNYHANRNR